MNFGYPFMLSQCPVNVLHALYFRHLAPSPFPFVADDLVNPFLTVFRSSLISSWWNHARFFLTDEWQVGKPAWKVAQILQSHIVDVLQHKRARSFVKMEVLATPKKKARLIQGHHNLRTAYHHPNEYRIMGCVMKDLGSTVFEFEGCRYSFHYAGGLNQNQLSELFTEAIAQTSVHRLFDERDGKNWDATMSRELLEQEAAVYTMLGMLAGYEHVLRSSGVRGRVFAHDGFFQVVIRYFTLWRRLSGDWNTSIGNSLLNVLIAWYAITHLPPHLRPTRVIALFMGDDYLGVYDFPQAVTPTDLASALNHNERKCGITPERGLFRDPLAVSFISMTPWPTSDGGYQFVPRPACQMAKLFWSVQRRQLGDIPGYASAIAITLWPAFYGFPMMMRFLGVHMKARPNWKHVESHIRQRFALEPVEVLWAQGFVYKYDMPLSATEFDMPTASGIWYHPVIRRMLDLEALDPNERKGCLAC